VEAKAIRWWNFNSYCDWSNFLVPLHHTSSISISELFGGRNAVVESQKSQFQLFVGLRASRV